MESLWYRQWKLHRVLRNRPLILKIETTNTCNSRCCFCAYGKSEREFSFLSLELFNKALEGYTLIGGDAVSLTPVVGDVLLDPILMQRFDVLKKFQGISDLSFTTNLIAHERYSDEEWCEILSRIRYLQVSIGGYDADTYYNMFGVDTFDVVWKGLHRIAAIRSALKTNVRLVVTIRAPDVTTIIESEGTSVLKKMGYDHVSGISSYGNWCGEINSSSMPVNTSINMSVEKTECCSMPALFMAVLSNGRVTGCSCVDHNGFLEIGDLNKETLGEIWQGKSRKELCRSFQSASLKKLCVDCSSYSAFKTITKMPFCAGVSNGYVPTEFYDNFSGG